MSCTLAQQAAYLPISFSLISCCQRNTYPREYTHPLTHMHRHHVHTHTHTRILIHIHMHTYTRARALVLHARAHPTASTHTRRDAPTKKSARTRNNRQGG